MSELNSADSRGRTLRPTDLVVAFAPGEASATGSRTRPAAELLALQAAPAGLALPLVATTPMQFLVRNIFYSTTWTIPADVNWIVVAWNYPQIRLSWLIPRPLLYLADVAAVGDTLTADNSVVYPTSFRPVIFGRTVNDLLLMGYVGGSAAMTEEDVLIFAG